MMGGFGSSLILPRGSWATPIGDEALPREGFAILSLPVLAGLAIDRARGRTGIAGGIVAGCLTFVAYGLAVCIDVYRFPDPTVVLVGGPSLFLLLFLTAGLRSRVERLLGIAWMRRAGPQGGP
jgi:hypothetical protein